MDGQKVVFHNPVQSREAGIACVYQELNIVKQLSVTDNVFMGRAVKKNGLLDYPRMYEEAKQALTTLGHPEIDVKMECGKLGTGQQQMVEIAKAVSLDAKLIIMDEPTSSLGKEEINQLMETVRGLKAKGVAILFVSHKLEELFELCDRVTVMRDGEHHRHPGHRRHDGGLPDHRHGGPDAGQPVSQGVRRQGRRVAGGAGTSTRPASSMT